jgi:hypothetical protein
MRFVSPSILFYPILHPHNFKIAPALVSWMFGVLFGFFPQHDSMTCLFSFLFLSRSKEFVTFDYTIGKNLLILATFHELFHEVPIHESFGLHIVSIVV